MTRRTGRRLALALLPLSAALGGLTGHAYAYWLPRGTGEGGGATAAFVPVEAVGPGAPGGALRPGAATDLTVRVRNPNGMAVEVTGFAVADAVEAQPAACAAYVRVDSDRAPEAGTVGAGEEATVTFAGALGLATDTPSDCQAATFTIALSLVVRR